MVVRKSPRPVERIANNTPEAWCATFSPGSCCHIETWQTLEFTGAEFAFHSLETALKFLLPEFSVHTMRLKCTKAKHGTSSRISHQVCTQEINPWALNPAQSQGRWTACHAFAAAKCSGVQISIRHFWQASGPGCTFVTALVGSVAQPTRLTRAVGAQNICEEAAAISAATFATESRAAPLHTGGP